MSQSSTAIKIQLPHAQSSTAKDPTVTCHIVIQLPYVTIVNSYQDPTATCHNRQQLSRSNCQHNRQQLSRSNSICHNQQLSRSNCHMSQSSTAIKIQLPHVTIVNNYQDPTATCHNRQQLSRSNCHMSHVNSYQDPTHMPHRQQLSRPTVLNHMRFTVNYLYKYFITEM
ncbi:hypothetical protein CEXT_107791 [Caerostris extrusa]|uniref:Uncharacterized protein n=1 Tax=Caerostris extrusa TaxID=172846 RepID=A0AAV4WFZ8_CAEEX|nr:hypothetical protein CEXT_107791 [Caerostris extrusa]